MDALANLLANAIWPVVLLVFFWPLRRVLSGDWSSIHQFFSRKNVEATAPGGFAIKTTDAAIEAQREAPPEPVLQTDVHDQAVLGTDKVDQLEPATRPPSERPAVNEMEDGLKVSVREIPEQDRVPVLLRELAEARIKASHEFFYARIFGSQIRALRELNARGSLKRSELEPLYNEVRSSAGQVYEAFPFDMWLGFMRNGLIKEENDRFEITVYGRDFLNYLNDNRLSDQKAL